MLFLLFFPVDTFAQNSESKDLKVELNPSVSVNNDIPEEVLKQVKEKESYEGYDDSEVRAWEVDLNGNVKEVVPLSQRNTVMAPPKDGFKYVFDRYNPSKVTRKWTYKSAGTVRIRNGLSTPTTANYKQETTTTTKWSVSGSISGSATIGNSFLGAIETKATVSAGRDKTWTAGRSYGIQQKIPAKTTAYITAYAVGVNAQGSLVYRKYSPSGTSLVGYYYESAGGTAISKNDANIEITSTEPIR